ncbi:MAG: hypothetical protein AAF484_17690 [Pseudomonadota bacterium]
MSSWWFSLLGSSAGFTLGSLLLKRYADTGAWTTLSMSFAVFAASNLLFAHVLKGGLGSGVVASSMLQIILMAVLGVVIFGERLDPFQIAGVALAAVSIFLMLHPGLVNS